MIFAFYGRRTETDFKDQACTDCNSSRDKSFQKNSVLSNSTIYDCNWELLCARRLFETHTKAASLLHIRLPLAVKTGVFFIFPSRNHFQFSGQVPSDCYHFIHRLLPAQKLLSPWVQVSPLYHQHDLSKYQALCPSQTCCLDFQNLLLCSPPPHSEPSPSQM